MPVANNIKIAFSGIISSLAVVVMLFAGLIPIASLALPAIAGCLFIPVVVEIGEKWGYACFLVTAVLSFFLTADKEAFVIFILFFGYYPILYSSFCKIKSKFLAYLLKLIIFNIAAVLDYLVTTFILGIPQESIEVLGQYTLLVVLILANVVFVVFDYALKGVVREYYRRFHKMAQKFLYKKM
ncbi:MAG: hypothetical protein R3Y35_09470 [Clostridia bacterium]